VGISATEAPRGLIYHRYQIDCEGQVELAKIVPPTSQNQARIEADLRALVEQIHQQTDESIAVQCERLVRCYDPCISCSTHFLKVKIERA
jgi:coenzyme F420-reducing hydrogenase alpha subunit